MEFVFHLNVGREAILKDLMVATKDWQSSTERDAPLRHHPLPFFLATYLDVSEARDPSKVSTGQQLQKAKGNRWKCSATMMGSAATWTAAALVLLGPVCFWRWLQLSGVLVGSVWGPVSNQPFYHWMCITVSAFWGAGIEFMEYLLGCLKPVTIDGTWWPKWSLSNGPAVDQKMDEYFRWEKMPDLSVDTCTLQELVNLWHDELGMCNVFTTASLLLEANSCTWIVSRTRWRMWGHSWFQTSFNCHMLKTILHQLNEFHTRFMHWRITLVRLWNLDISGRCSLGLTMRTPNHLIIYPLQLPLTYKMLLWSGCIVRFKQTDLTLILSGFFANSLQLLLSRDVLWATWFNLWMTWIVTIGTFGIEAVISW